MSITRTSELNVLKAPEKFYELITSSKKSIAWDSKGNFHEENFLISIIRRLARAIFKNFFGQETRKYIGLSKVVVHALDQIEQTRVEIGKKGQFLTFIKIAKEVKKNLKKFTSEPAKQELLNLKTRLSSIQYRLGENESTKYAKKTDPDQSILTALTPHLRKWKEAQVTLKSKPLDVNDLKQLEEVSKYPKFAKILEKNALLRDRFFQWSILEKHAVDPFVLFNKTINTLIDVKLSDWLATNGKDDLKIEETQIEGRKFKDLTLTFEGSRQSILNEKHIVTFSYDYQLSIAQIFKIFKDRELEVGDIIYVKDTGFCNHNPNYWGPWNPTKNGVGGYETPDMNDPEWIKKVKFSEVITEEEAQNRFEDEKGQKLTFAPTDYVFTVVAKNEHAHPEFTGSHVMLGIAVPLDNGRRGIVYMSKFPWKFPDPVTQKKEYARLSIDTVPGAIQLPDENACFKIGRDKEGVSVRVTPQEAQIALDRIKRHREAIMNKNFFFQFIDDNCTIWTFNIIKHLISKERRDAICGIRMKDARPTGIMGKFMAVWRKLPRKMQSGFFNVIIGCMKPNTVRKRKKDGTFKEIGFNLQNAPWNVDRHVPHPGVLIHNKRENKAKLNLKN